jgi:hypothetical protein
MTGISLRHGAGWWGLPMIPERRFRGYTVIGASHWVFEGTGLANGDGPRTANVVPRPFCPCVSASAPTTRFFLVEDGQSKAAAVSKPC